MRAVWAVRDTSLAASRHRRAPLPLSLRRFLAVVALAVGGWLVSAVLAGTATAQEPTTAPADEAAPCPSVATTTPEDTGSEPASPGPLDCADDPDTDEPVEPTAPESNGDDADDTDNADDTTPAEPGTPTAPAGDADEPHGTDSTDSTDGTDSQKPEQLEQPESEDGSEPASVPLPGGESALLPAHGPRGAPSEDDEHPTLLGATTGTLLGTTSKLTATATELTGMLGEALPAVTDTVGGAVEEVVDVPAELPGSGLTDTLPGIELPRLPIGSGDPAPGPPGATAPTEPAEPRAEPAVPAVPLTDAEQPTVTSPSAPDRTGERDTTTSPWTSPVPTDDAHDTRHSEAEGPERPLGPLVPSPPAPASVAGPSTTVAHHQDGTHAARGEVGVLGDLPTVTQLRLLGVSRDQDVVGAGRAAALPTTSPD
ncbi:hypothetical protein [Saccharomonospora piscinae]|uniref:hypothetical protein n=1 Tax=Saccharomonospora piscinae TaxID=687388 RepID=UPI0012DDBBED|nr:hypothetical protein [Saccharomonospora piscinae]